MHAVTLKEAKRNLERLVEQALANAAHLRRSIAQAQAGDIQERELLDV